MAQIIPRGDSPVGEQEEGDDTGKSATELTSTEFFEWVEEIHWQPDWRKGSDRDADYYDNNQLDPETLAEIERRGMLPVVKNMIQPTIDVVLGLEAKMRTDWRVTADSDAYTEVAEAMSQKIFEAERESKADRAIADAHASQVKAGVGWVEIVRSSDPFGYPYEANHVHRRELYWDWNSRKPMLQDKLYLIRRRWFYAKQVAAFFPNFKMTLEQAGEGFPVDSLLTNRFESAQRGFEVDQELRTTLEEWEWRNPSNNRIALFEVWYSRYVRGHVLKLPDDRTVEFDRRNRFHTAAVASGKIKPIPAVYTKLRRAIFCGPFKLADVDAGRRETSYVPFFAYREDLTGVPYGLIRTMISPQDEINARTQKMLWLLGAKRVTMDADALDEKSNDVSEVLDEITRADAAVVLNPNRTNRDQYAFRVDENLSLADAQFKILQENKNDLQMVRGIFNAMLGSEKGATSGIAINSLIEQSTTVLASIVSSYQDSRREVGNRLMELIRQDLVGRQVEVVTEESGANRKTIILNQPVRDQQTGMTYLKNDVERSRVKVGIMEVQTSPAYRQQQLTMLAEVMKGLPPEMQAILAPAYLEMSDIPKRKEIADQFRKKLGLVDPENMAPEERQQFEQEQAQAAEMNQRMALAQLTEQEAKAAKLKAEAEKITAEASSMVSGVDGQVNDAVAKTQQAAQEQVAALTQQVQALERGIADKRLEIAARYKADTLKAQLEAASKVRATEASGVGDKAVSGLKEMVAALQADLREMEQRMKAEHKDALYAERDRAETRSGSETSEILRKLMESSEKRDDSIAAAIEELGGMMVKAQEQVREAIEETNKAGTERFEKLASMVAAELSEGEDR
jgi:hypothetical protein